MSESSEWELQVKQEKGGLEVGFTKLCDLGETNQQFATVCNILQLSISLIVSGRYPENSAIWLVLGAGSIFLSPDHGHGNQLR